MECSFAPMEGVEDVPECFATDLLDNVKMSFDQAAVLTGSLFSAGAYCGCIGIRYQYHGSCLFA